MGEGFSGKRERPSLFFMRLGQPLTMVPLFAATKEQGDFFVFFVASGAGRFILDTDF
jgi:hypothetical protein